jgi:hypothetical protein
MGCLLGVIAWKCEETTKPANRAANELDTRYAFKYQLGAQAVLKA